MNLFDNVSDIVAALHEKQVISEDLLSSIKSLDVFAQSKALISALREAIKVDGKALQIFASILCKFDRYQYVGEQMLKDYDNEVFKQTLNDEKHGGFKLIKSSIMLFYIYRWYK